MMTDVSSTTARDEHLPDDHVAPGAWSAVGSMSLCVALLIASEFLPVSLLTPIATDLRATEGMTGQAISISGLFAVVSSLLISSVASRFDRKHVLVALTAVMLVSLLLAARASSFAMLMIARALLGITIGGFWALATATVMRLVPASKIGAALGMVYMGNAVATALAAPIGSALGSLIGWRGALAGLIPLVMVNIFWQCKALPSLPSNRPAASLGAPFALLRRRRVAIAMLGIMLTFGGAFAAFTYFRPLLERATHVSPAQLSLLLLGLGVAGFVGTSLASRLVTNHLYRLLRWLPLLLGLATVVLLMGRSSLPVVAIALIVWGTLNSAIPVVWSNWLSREAQDDPESGGGLMVAAIQLSIMLGASFGGLLLDKISIVATLVGSAGLLFVATFIAGQIRPPSHD